MKMQLGAAQPAAESARGLYHMSGYMAPLGLLLCGQDDRPYLSPNQPKWRNGRGEGRGTKIAQKRGRTKRNETK